MVTTTQHSCQHHAPQTPNPAAKEAEVITPHRRFDRLVRLTGAEGFTRLRAAHVAVYGLGGVGSFAAESLARSGVGTLTVVDFDDVCVTNTNRQLHALKGNVGKPKAYIMRERLQLVDPQAVIHAKRAFYNGARADQLIPSDLGFAIDAIDNISAKAHLLATLTARRIPVVTCLGSAGKWDPTRIQVAPLHQTHTCGLARALKKILREKYALAPEDSGITAVFSDEQRRGPFPVPYDGEEGFRCVCPNGDNGVNECEEKSVIDGSASFVTGAFGLFAASVVVRQICEGG
ncbi:MAG: tRNA threonylcarbamoyladenosine dehydratase [Myxococcota bacterium]